MQSVMPNKLEIFKSYPVWATKKIHVVDKK